MRSRTSSAAALAAAAVIVTNLPSIAAATGLRDVPLRASEVRSSQRDAARPGNWPPAVGLCGTGFGTPTDSPDGIVSWNDTHGDFDVGGAADFKCTSATKVNRVWVGGYYGTAQETFHLTFYQNDSADGSNEANDRRVVCDYPALTGTAGGKFPDGVTTKLNLTTPCKFKAGKKYWVAVQNSDPAGPWYWKVQNAKGGSTIGDWIDRGKHYSPNCPTFDNDLYLAECLGDTYPDYMLELH